MTIIPGVCIQRHAAAVLLAVLSLGVRGHVDAAGYCASGADACIVVNSTADVAARDGVVSLREALMLQDGSIGLDDLDSAEAGQVHIATGLSFTGAVHVNFDTAVFCDDCPTVIRLQPPLLGEPDRVSLPPGLASFYDSDAGPRSTGHIGMGLLEGQEVPVSVTIDGSLLGKHDVGLRLVGWGELQGMQFRNFRGTAIEVTPYAAKGVVIGADGDGLNDAAEAVTFDNNSRDIVFLR